MPDERRLPVSQRGQGSDQSQKQHQSQQDTDQQLVNKVLKGSREAFNLLVLRHQHRVMALVSRFVHDPQEAEDVCQEAFIKAYQALAKFRGDSAFYTWLYRIAVNTAKNHLLSRSRRPPSVDVDLQDYEEGLIPNLAGVGAGGAGGRGASVGGYPTQRLQESGGPQGWLATDELREAIEQTIANLPEDLRTAFTLREFSGLSYEEITQVMDCPVGTVRSRIFRAREAIDRRVKELLS